MLKVGFKSVGPKSMMGSNEIVTKVSSITIRNEVRDLEERTPWTVINGLFCF